MVESVYTLSVPYRGAWREKMGCGLPVDRSQYWQLSLCSGGYG